MKPKINILDYNNYYINHIVAGTLFSWLPLTQGLYISHMTTQPECMVFQMAECLVIGLGVVVMLKNKQEDIIYVSGRQKIYEYRA